MLKFHDFVKDDPLLVGGPCKRDCKCVGFIMPSATSDEIRRFRDEY